jgi:hypothetical protein
MQCEALEMLILRIDNMGGDDSRFEVTGESVTANGHAPVLSRSALNGGM